MKNYPIVDDMYTSSIEEKIVNVLTAKASQEEVAEVRQWLSENEGNRKMYDEYVNIWKVSNAVNRNDDYSPDVAWASLNKRMKPEKPRKLHLASLKKAMMVAAMVTVVFLAGIAFNKFTTKTTVTINQSLLTYTEYTSPYGSKSKVKLPDGSSVWLNAGSTLRYSSDFNEKNREVYLEGEGYFDVALNEQTYFLVQTSAITIKVLGTAFNVKAYPEESVVETTVERGTVQLINPLSASQEATILRAQQKAVITKENLPDNKSGESSVQENKSDIKPSNSVPITGVKVNSNIKTEVYTSWKDQRWVIESEKLSSLAVKLERRFNVHFVFDDEALKENVFSGKLEDETLDQVLEAIKLTSPILYRVKNNTVTLTRNKMFNQKK